MFIANCLEQNARVRPDRPAVTFGDRGHTWSQLLERVHRVSNMLISHGATPGTPVVSVLANSLELVELQLACLAIGAVYVPVMPTSVHREIELVVRDSAARIVVCDPAFVADLVSAAPDVRVIAVGGAQPGATDYATAVAAASGTDPRVSVPTDAVAAIRYTSGTTGVPKGCVTTHDRLAWATAIYLTRMRLDPDDRATLSSPLSAGLGIALLHVYVCAGISMWVLPRFDPEQLLDLIERERITLVYAIESTFARLSRSPSVLTRDLSSVRLMYANSPGKDAAEGFRTLRANPTWRGGFFNAYGSTEAGGSVTFNLPEDIDEALSDPALAARTESIGRDAPFCRIECLDDDGRPVPDGEVGELVISAPSVFAGYLGHEEASAAVLRDGRLFTGDLAHRDSAGFVHLAGRKREMIKSGGLNVYPAEVEMVLSRHPDVLEAAVVGVPDQKWGEMVVAFVVVRPGCDAERLKTHCAEHLAGYKRPKEITLVEALPKGETGKILKRALVDRQR
ncbi:AMP-binding protein [Streptomyces sp. NPDC004542]|uniref:class I adenylate-forming enzyme family protein n=1 Tax=Streptomyces sp. NPDC004542 TaxID=3154281 RepID=UPI0033ADF23C